METAYISLLNTATGVHANVTEIVIQPLLIMSRNICVMSVLKI